MLLVREWKGDDMSTTAPGRRERGKSAKRARIFAAAAELFAERGFGAVTTREIAERADVADGTLFRYAATKSELLLMVYNEATIAAIEKGIEQAAGIGNSVERVLALVEPLIAEGRQQQENAVVYQRELLFGSATDVYRAQGLDTVVRMERTIAELLLATPPTTVAAPPADEYDAMCAARAIFALVHMAIAHPIARHQGEEKLADPICVLRTQIELIMAGLSAARGRRDETRASTDKTRTQKMTEINKVTVLGTGVLGSQIAFQTAFTGLDVVAYDISDEALTKANKRLTKLVGTYTEEVPSASDGKAGGALERITLSSDLQAAVAEADLIIEAVPEDLSIKNDIYAKLDQFAPDHTIFATNSSTLLPSDMMEATGRPDKFLALHFANRIWVHNSAEIMKTAQTASETYQTVVAFAETIGMVPIELKKEKAGYVTDSLLKPFLIAGLGLLVDGYAEPEMIDKAWRLATGAPLGPLEIIDEVGLMTPYNVAKQSGPEGERLAEFLKENYIDKGKLGRATGEGIYSYPK